MGYIASTALIFSIDTDLSSTNDNASYRSSQQSKAFIGLGGILLTWIWSTSDAVRVAKVNNMAWRDKEKKVSFQLEPKLDNRGFTNSLHFGFQLKVSLD